MCVKKQKNKKRLTIFLPIYFFGGLQEYPCKILNRKSSCAGQSQITGSLSFIGLSHANSVLSKSQSLQNIRVVKLIKNHKIYVFQ
jgi:hypothetical protein